MEVETLILFLLVCKHAVADLAVQSFRKPSKKRLYLNKGLHIHAVDHSVLTFAVLVFFDNDNNLNSLNLFIANRILTAYKNLSFTYALSYIFIWSTYYLLLSIIKFRLRDWFIGIKLGIRKSKQSERNPLSKEQMLYLKNNFGRIFY